MFPDSDIAATFSCGSNKTAYITKFGLAPFITKELTEQVNQAAGFVPMLDESLNKTTKTKQLDIHLRYWAGERVRLRHFGSQFMGRVTKRPDLCHTVRIFNALSGVRRSIKPDAYLSSFLELHWA